MKRDLVRVGGEWRMRARDRGEWRRFRETVINETSYEAEGETQIDDRYRCQPHPGLQGKGRRATTYSFHEQNCM